MVTIDTKESKNKLRKFIEGRGFALLVALCMVAVGAVTFSIIRGGITTAPKVENPVDDVYQGIFLYPEEGEMGGEPTTPTIGIPEIPADEPDPPEPVGSPEPSGDETNLIGGFDEETASVMSDATLQSGDAKEEPVVYEDEVGGFEEEDPPEEDSAADADITDDGKYIMPVSGAVLKDFSDSVLVFSNTLGDYRVHLGIDISASVGTNVKCVQRGIVESVYLDEMMGMTVVMLHSGDRRSIYQNLSETLAADVYEGAILATGTVIGFVGETAAAETAEGPHLHFEMSENGEYIDPAAFISGS